MPDKSRAATRFCTLLLPVIGVLLAGASAASADTFSYNHYGPVPGTGFENVTITYTNTNPSVNTYGDGAAVSEYGGMGEIRLYQNSNANSPFLDVFCMDVYHWLAGSDTQNIGTLGLSGSGVPNPTLTTIQLNKIAQLVNQASVIISTAPDGAANSSDASAALQLAIWEIEYKTNLLTGAATLASGPNGPSFNPDNNNLLTLAATYIANYAGNGSGDYYNNIALLTTTGNVKNNQDLVYIVDCGPTGTGCGSVSGSPLPGALPLMASGLGALGLLGWRRKRKAAA